MAWQETALTVMEGDNGDMMQTVVCIVLEDRAGGLQREANFRLSSVTGTAGEFRFSYWIRPKLYTLSLCLKDKS